MYSFIYTNYVDFEHIFTLTITKMTAARDPMRSLESGLYWWKVLSKDRRLRTKKEMYQQIQSEVDSKLIYILIISYNCEYMIKNNRMILPVPIKILSVAQEWSKFNFESWPLKCVINRRPSIPKTPKIWVTSLQGHYQCQC